MEFSVAELNILATSIMGRMMGAQEKIILHPEQEKYWDEQYKDATRLHYKILDELNERHKAMEELRSINA